MSPDAFDASGLLFQLRKAREAQGLTRAQIAAELERTPRWVARWEAGEIAVGLRMLGLYGACVGLKIRLEMAPREPDRTWSYEVATVHGDLFARPATTVIPSASETPVRCSHPG